MNYTKKSLRTFVFTSMLITSSIFLHTSILQAGPSARTIMNTGEVISNWIRRNSDNIEIPIPKKVRVTERTVTRVHNYLVKDSDGQVYCLGQAQYSDGSYSEPYYSDSYYCQQ